MAKARQVGTPHSLQLVLGKSLKIWIPVKPMDTLLSQEPLSAERKAHSGKDQNVFNAMLYASFTQESGPSRGQGDSSP
jgi:hypothetical protein